MTVHMSYATTTDPMDDGFYEARCECGYVQGPFPDVETVIDDLMGHAFAMGVLEGRTA